MKRKDFVHKLKAGGCLRCGIKHPNCLTFHHLDPNSKVKKLNALFRTASYAVIMAEVAKCILLCVNCHRVQHADMVKKLATHRIRNFMVGKRCVHCNEGRIEALQLEYRPLYPQRKQLSHYLAHISNAALEIELEKMQVTCGNCRTIQNPN